MMMMMMMMYFRTFTFGTGEPTQTSPTVLFKLIVLFTMMGLFFATLISVGCCYSMYRYRRAGLLLGSENTNYRRLIAENSTFAAPEVVVPGPDDPLET